MTVDVAVNLVQPKQGELMTMTADYVWFKLLEQLVLGGHDVAPRHQVTLEMLGVTSLIDMNYPILTIKGRRLSYGFMAREAYCILTGNDRVDALAPWAPSVRQFSDDGDRFFGAYGPKIVAQVGYVVRTLAADPSSRQAVVSIWRENPPASKDIPCTLSAQWLIRDAQLCCIDTMRSSDIWLGWPYDVFTFSMASALIRLKLRALGIDVKLGWLRINAGSQHLYARNYLGARRVIDEGTEQALTYLAPTPAFENEGQLLECLHGVAEYDYRLRHSAELVVPVHDAWLYTMVNKSLNIN
jgi:thymidylate synthase